MKRRVSNASLLGRFVGGGLVALLVAGTVVAVPASTPASAAVTQVNPFAFLGASNTGQFTVIAKGDALFANHELEGAAAVFGTMTVNRADADRFSFIQQAAGTGAFTVPTIDGQPVRILAGAWAGPDIADVANTGATAGTPEAKAIAKLVSLTGLTSSNQGFTRLVNSSNGSMDVKSLTYTATSYQTIQTVNTSVKSYFTDFDNRVASLNACFSTLFAVGSTDVNFPTPTSGPSGFTLSNMSTTKPNVVNYSDIAGQTIKPGGFQGWVPTATAPLVIKVAAGTTTINKVNIEGWNTSAGAQQSYAKYILWDMSQVTGNVTMNDVELGAVWAPSANLTVTGSQAANGQWLVNNLTAQNSSELHQHTFGATFPCDMTPPATAYDLALKKTVASVQNAPKNTTVTFNLEVINQGSNPVNGVTVTDYIDPTSFDVDASLLTAGTTTGAAALSYAWTGTSTSKPAVTISGVIPANSSVVLPVTLRVKQPAKLSGLLNTAEISRFDNDGNSANGDSASTTPTVYDVDSRPDATNDDMVSDDVVNLKRWTNTAPNVGSENTTVGDEDDHDIATVPVYDLSLIKVRASDQPATVTAPSNPAAPEATFDITVKNQGQNPVYNVTVLDSPQSPLTRSTNTLGSQTVTSSTGASRTISYTAASGVFTIPQLAAGESVTFKVKTNLALTNLVQVNTAEITGFDDDNNTTNTKPAWVFDRDSVPDTNATNDALAATGTTFPVDSHNDIDHDAITQDAADEDDHDSEGVQLGLLRLGSTVYIDADKDNVGDAGEEVPGVLVQLFKWNGTSFVQVASTVTDAKGDYSFDKLFPGDYQVGIPTAQTGGGVNTAALTDTQPVPLTAANIESANFDNDGSATSGFLSRSATITLTYGAEPTNDTADNADADALTSPLTYADANSNLNIDFVFERYTYEIGNLVWLDNGAGNHFNNGIADADEAGISGVTVELYRDNGAGGAVANDGLLAASERIATTVTDANGFYDFRALPAATDYVVAIVKSTVPADYAPSSTVVTVPAADGIDNDNNAANNLASVWSSGKVALGPGANSERTGEKDGTTGTSAQPTAAVDGRADQTVDFGFVPSVRIGNQVWRDESDDSPATQAATDNNGRFDTGERGIAGVTVQLWRDVNNNGTFERAGADSAGLVATTTTNSEGNYWFTGVRPGQPYFVVIPSLGSAGVLRPESSAGQSTSVTASDNDDDGAPVGLDLSVSKVFTPTMTGAATGERDAVEPGDGVGTTDANAELEANAATTTYADNNSDLRIDFGFVSVPLYRLGNLVWLDNGGSPYSASKEANGKADPNEPGIAGVKVTLYAGADTALTTPLAVVTTDANGEYAFENLAAGTYLVAIDKTSNAAALGGLVSTLDGVAANSDVDNDDNGVNGSTAWVSTPVTLGAANAYAGAEPTDESRRLGEAGTYDTGVSWGAVSGTPATFANNRSNLTVDFGFTPVYRLGNLVWFDANNNGRADVSETGLAGVSVTVRNSVTGTTWTAVTDSDGKYLVTGLPAGSYTVTVDSTTVPAGFVPGGVTVGNADDDTDNDNNAEPVGGDFTATVTLGGAEPVNEVKRLASPVDDDADSFSDAASNVTVDFGFWPQLRIGNVVWIDESDADPATVTPTDNNGVLDAGETVLDGVVVTVWRDGGNGSFDAHNGPGSDDVFAGMAITDAEGNWWVSHLRPGTYFAAIESLPAPYDNYVSSLGQSGGDNTDHGAAGTDGANAPYVSVTSPITLAAGAAPTSESDVVPAADGSAEAEANVVTGVFRDADSDLTIDQSFVAPPTYRIGNLVWLDANRNGKADTSETGVDGVLVQLLDAYDNVVAETVTTGGGHYDFRNLDAGEYAVNIPHNQTPTLAPLSGIIPDALKGLTPTLFAGDADDVAVDNDSNGDNVGADVRSDKVTLGGSATTFNTEPVSEVLRDGSASDDDSGWAGGPDSRSEFTVDFGFYSGLRLGDTVWFDDGRQSDGSYLTSAANDGIFQSSELPAANVEVQLYADNGNGIFEPGAADGAPVLTAATDAQGNYVFTGLDESVHYWVAIPDSQTSAGGPLNGYRASTPIWADGAGTNSRNHGAAEPGFASVSSLVTLVRGGMAYGEASDEPRADALSGQTLPDVDSDLVIDFGFAPVPTYRIGNLVWKDTNDNGLVDAGENGIPGVTVDLFADDGDGVFSASSDTKVDTVVTAAGTNVGRYSFEGLKPGVYFVHIPGQPALDGLFATSPVLANPDTDVDNDNNAVSEGTANFVSGALHLGDVDAKGEDGEPQAETDANTSAAAEDGVVIDEHSNLTVDFGFIARARIGNQVWLDESDADQSTHEATDNNGSFDANERGLAGVDVQLWRDVNGDGFQGDAVGSDDVLVDTQTTDVEGNYDFAPVVIGPDYYVAVPAVSIPGTSVRSSAGQSTSASAHDNDDDGAPSGHYLSVSKAVTPDEGNAPLSETDAAEPGNGPGGIVDASAEDESNIATGYYADANSDLAVDFGFIAVPTYRVGNLVWIDSNNDGIAQDGEPGIAGVTVVLLDGSGNELGSTSTDASGHYSFGSLVAGDYQVKIPAGQAVLAHLDSSDVDSAVDDADNTDDGAAVVQAGSTVAWASAVFTLGAGPDSGTETESVTETVRSNDSTDDDSAWSGGTDARSNFTVDFGFYQLLRVGNTVWLDNGGNGGSFVADNENNGTQDSGEQGIAGVRVFLLADNGDGVPGAGDSVAGSAVTDSQGHYYFVDLHEGTYIAVIDPTSTNVGGPLFGLHSSEGQAADYLTDNRDQGAPFALSPAVSKPVTLSIGTMTNGDSAAEPAADTATGVTVPDLSSNLAVDFGFVATPSYAVGNLVWNDANNNGTADSGESGIDGIEVRLYRDTNDDGVLQVGADQLIGSTTTSGGGRYNFENLAAGSYLVYVPAQNPLNGLLPGGTPNAASSPDVDNDNNANVFGTGGWVSPKIQLGGAAGPADHAEPVKEHDGTDNADATAQVATRDDRANQTVDFGFWSGLRLGNQLWIDNGGEGAAYVPAHEDNGIYDADETPLASVTVELWAVNGPTQTKVTQTTTDSQGRYFFEHVAPGDYRVVVPDFGGTMHSSTGQIGLGVADDGKDDGAPAAGIAAQSDVITLASDAAPTAETDGPGVTAHSAEAYANGVTGDYRDVDSYLTVDFGFSPKPGYAIGNLVWEDFNNNGKADAGEPGMGGITVELWRDVDHDGVYTVGTDSFVASTTTDAVHNVGRYVFEGLDAGDYLVRVPVQDALNGLRVGGSATTAADVDNDNNALADIASGWTSPQVSLGGPVGPADHAEPTGETDGIDGVDAESLVVTRDDRSNQTVDFGFWRGLRLGNQVWLDEGAGDHQDNGVFDADENPVIGLDVQLWEDDGDGVFSTATDTLIGTTVTNGEGRYFFTQLAEGDYFVLIPAAPGTLKSSYGTVGTGLADDGKDDGAPTGSYAAVSGVLSLSVGGAPTGEKDGPGAGGADAEAYANGKTPTYPDVNSYLTADFGLVETPLFRIGNLVWFDSNNDGIAQATEQGVQGVLVQLLDADDNVIAETVTDAQGRYVFTNLAAGNYKVQIPMAQSTSDAALAAQIVPTAIAGLIPSTHVQPAGNENDNDANGVETIGVNARSAVITLGTGSPVNETVRAGVATDDDLGQASPRIEDFRSDFSVDFGFYSISLGNLVFIDRDGDGYYEPADGDFGVDGVVVNLVTEAGVIAQTTTTSNGGEYLFTGLREGDKYYVEIPGSNFAPGGALYGYFSSAGTVGGDTSINTEDGPDRGVDPTTPYGAVRSEGLITATATNSPIDDGEDVNPDNDNIRPDESENLIVDFGFYRMQLGGTVFVDSDNDGSIDAGKVYFPGVTVLLYTADGTPYLLPNGAQYSAVTDANGNYVFSGLPAGGYIVEIPASQFGAGAPLDGWANSDGNGDNPDVEANDLGIDNGAPVSGTIFSKTAIRSTVLTIVQRQETFGDGTDTPSYLDSMSNLTVDFGFWHAQAGLELGNQLWFDENKNGVLDAGEKTVPAGVELRLLDSATGDTVATTFTDGKGQYLFTGLPAGSYVVWIVGSNFAPGKPLAGWVPTTGSGASADPNDATDSDSNALPLTSTGVKSAAVVLAAAAPVGEIDPASSGLQDRQSNLTVDFGFVRETVLAFTGADAAGSLKTMALLLALGGMLMVGARRRPSQR